MWFNQIAKFIVPKVPEPLKPVAEQAKPLIEKTTPFAKELCSKAPVRLGYRARVKHLVAANTFNESNTKDVNADSDPSYEQIRHPLRAKAAEIKDDAWENLMSQKPKPKKNRYPSKKMPSEKLADIKDTANEKIGETKEKDEVKAQTADKIDDAKETATEKFDEAKSSQRW